MHKSLFRIFLVLMACLLMLASCQKTENTADQAADKTQSSAEAGQPDSNPVPEEEPLPELEPLPEGDPLEEVYSFGGFEYELYENGMAVIVGHEGLGATESLDIPAEVDSHRVIGFGGFGFCSDYTLKSVTIADGIRKIWDYTFYNCGELTTITMPDSVTYIGEGAFMNCDSLESVTIPKYTTYIGPGAFYGCWTFPTINIPNGVTELQGNPFADCRNLESIVVSSNHPTFAVVDGVLFSKPDHRLVCYPSKRPGRDYIVPDGTLTIEEHAFGDSEYLVTVSIPDGVTDIGPWAFSGSTSMKSIIVPESVKNIGQDAFGYGAFNLPDLNVTVVQDSYAEQYCKDHGIKYIYPGDSLPEDDSGSSSVNEKTSDSAPSDNEKKPDPEPFKTAGNIVTFGHYEQDNDSYNGKEEIEWIVLEYQNGRSLLLSKYGLDYETYHKELDNITWEKCTLRSWLNNEFMNAAFSETEQQAILLTDVDNSYSQGYKWNTSGGYNTKDHIFLLSYAEANRYLNLNNEYRWETRTSPTVYARRETTFEFNKNKTADGEISSGWWLRSPGSEQYEAAAVTDAGSIGYNYSSWDSLVRPALWIDLESDFF